ncbi:MAG: beta-lactamase family protein [Acidobacteriota bacterium]|nr:beta-lactamase family protein [Acidobacteriota bacterium]
MKLTLTIIVIATVIVIPLHSQTILRPSPPGTNKHLTNAEMVKEIETFVDKLAAEDKFSGVVIVAKDGLPIFKKAWGLANVASKVPNNVNTKFNLGSMNKMFTAVAVAQLMERGKLSFDDTVGKHLPDYPNKAVADGVTIHHLLTHTSGTGSYWNEKFFKQRATLRTVTDHLPLFADEPLAFKPGEKFRYSNAGFTLLGAIIERVSGQSYYDYVKENIYKPAGMTDTGFYEPDSTTPNLATGYTNASPDGQREPGPRREYVPGPRRENTDLREIKGGPAGGGYSTVEDLLKFHLALRSHKLLNRKYTDIVTTGKVETGMPMRKYAYGFGDEIFGGKHIVGHNGGAPGIAANFEMYPELGYTAIILSNYDPPAMMPVVMKIREAIPSAAS